MVVSYYKTTHSQLTVNQQTPKTGPTSSITLTAVFPEPGRGHWEWQPLGKGLSTEQMTHLSQDFHGIYFSQVGALNLSHLEHL